MAWKESSPSLSWVHSSDQNLMELVRYALRSKERQGLYKKKKKQKKNKNKKVQRRRKSVRTFSLNKSWKRDRASIDEASLYKAKETRVQTRSERVTTALPSTEPINLGSGNQGQSLGGERVAFCTLVIVISKSKIFEWKIIKLKFRLKIIITKFQNYFSLPLIKFIFLLFYRFL